jgi:hypothetical protein
MFHLLARRPPRVTRFIDREQWQLGLVASYKATADTSRDTPKPAVSG